MTISSTTNRVSFAGNDVTVAFATSPVVFFDSADLTVYTVITATGVATLKTLTTDYTVTGGSGLTGTVTMLTAPATGTTLLIVRDVAITQGSDLVNNDASDAEVIEDAFDRLTMISQQLDTKIGRALVLADSDVSGASTELPTPEAGTVIGWDAAGTALQNYDAESAVTVATNVTFLSSLTGSVSRTVQQELEEGIVNIKRFGAYCDDSHDDSAAWILAAAAIGDTTNNLRSGLRLLVPGPSVIGSSVTFTKRSLIIEGQGWGYRTDDNTRRSYVRWDGAAGSPMFKFVDCFGGVALRDLNLKGLSTAKPSAAIEFNEGAATGVPNANLSLDNVRIGSFAGETDAGTQFTSGIVFTGTNNNSEHRFNGIYITGCSSYGIKQTSIQNLNVKLDHATIASCGSGLYITGGMQGSNWNMSANTIDIETPLNDGAASAVDPLIICTGYYSESAGRMASFAGGARLAIYGGQFQITSSLNADGKIATQQGNFGLLFHLNNFKFNQASAPSGSPQLSFRSSVAGAAQRHIILDGMTGMSYLTGGTMGLDVATRGPTDRTYVYYREYAQTASSTPSRVAQNFLHGLSVDWDINAFQARNNSALEFKDDFTGVTLETTKWVGRVGSDGSCVTPAIVSGVHGGACRATTGASATADNATNGFLLRGEAHWIAAQGGLSFECRVMPPSGITSLAFFCGFTSGLGTGVLANADFPFTLVGGALTSNAVDAVGFLFDTSATAGTVWHLVGVANNVDATMQHLAVGPSVSTNVKLRIDVSDTGVATFSINGAVVGTTLTGAVTPSVALAPVVCAFRRGAATSTFNYDYINVNCNRSL